MCNFTEPTCQFSSKVECGRVSKKVLFTLADTFIDNPINYTPAIYLVAYALGIAEITPSFPLANFIPLISINFLKRNFETCCNVTYKIEVEL